MFNNLLRKKVLTEFKPFLEAKQPANSPKNAVPIKTNDTKIPHNKVYLKISSTGKLIFGSGRFFEDCSGLLTSDLMGLVKIYSANFKVDLYAP